MISIDDYVKKYTLNPNLFCMSTKSVRQRAAWIKLHPESILLLSSPSTKEWKCAISISPSLVVHHPLRNSDITLFALSCDPRVCSVVPFSEDDLINVGMRLHGKQIIQEGLTANINVLIGGIRLRPSLIKYITEPSVEMQCEAVRLRHNAIRFIKAPSEEAVDMAIRQQPYCVFHQALITFTAFCTAIECNNKVLQGSTDDFGKAIPLHCTVNSLTREEEERLSTILSMYPSAIKRITINDTEQVFRLLKNNTNTLRFLTSAPDPYYGIAMRALKYANTKQKTSFMKKILCD